MLGAYKDLTDALPSKIGGPNKFGIPPAYFDADNEPLLDEYVKLFALMQAPPANAQKSDTPFKDVVDLGIAIARAKGLDGRMPKRQAASASGCSLPRPTAIRTSAMRARTNTREAFRPAYPKIKTAEGSGPAIKNKVAAFDPALILRDDREEARAGQLDHRYNHWTAVRDALMNAHADIFPQVPAIVKTLPDPIDQMKLFELIQIIPGADQIRAQVRRPARLQGFRPDDHGISAKQQHVRLWTGRQGKNIRDLPRNPRCDVAVQSQIRTGACQIRRDQGAVRGLQSE